MKFFSIAPIQRHLSHLFLIALTLGSISAAQQSSPVLDKTRTFSITTQDNIVTVRNIRTGEVIAVAHATPAPGNVPPPATNYSFSTLSVPAGGTTGYAAGISSNGKLTAGGYYTSTEDNGLVYDSGQQKVLAYPGAAQTNLNGVNDSGEVVGNYGQSTSTLQGFVYKNGTYKPFKTSAETSNAISVNDSGAIVGSYTPDGGTYVSVLIVGGKHTVIQNGTYATFATGINSSGEIVGTYENEVFNGFTDVNGTFTTIQVPGAAGTYPQAINDSGVIAGFYGDAQGETHGFVLNNGQYTTVDYPGATYTQIFGIDDAGDLTGFYESGPCPLSSQACGFLATVTK
jgi:hypothetical protein